MGSKSGSKMSFFYEKKSLFLKKKQLKILKMSFFRFFRFFWNQCGSKVMASFFWVGPLLGPLFGPPFWGKSRFCQFRGNESQGFWDLKFDQKRGPKSDITFLTKKRDFWRFHSTIIFANTLFDMFFDMSFLWRAGKNRVVEWNRQNRDFPDFGGFWELLVNYLVII